MKKTTFATIAITGLAAVLWLKNSGADLFAKKTSLSSQVTTESVVAVKSGDQGLAIPESLEAFSGRTLKAGSSEQSLSIPVAPLVNERVASEPTNVVYKPNGESSDAMSGISPTAVQFHGVVRPAYHIEVPALVAGMIKTLHVEEGQRVSAGQLLVQLNDDIPRARLQAAIVDTKLQGALKRAEAELRRTQNRLQRMQSLPHRAMASFELQDAQNSVEQADASVEQQRDTMQTAMAAKELAEVQLQQYSVVSPIDGVVTEIHIKAGAVDTTTAILTICDFSSLEVEMHVPSGYFGKIQQGSVLPLMASAPVDRRIDSKVLSVSSIIDSASDTFRCLLSIDNSEFALPAGFRVHLLD